MGQKYAAYNAQGTIIGFYDSDISPVPAGVDAIEITDAQWQACLQNQGDIYVVDGELVPVPPPSDAELLANAKTAQATILTNACNTHCNAQYTSSALGSAYAYNATVDDQRNLTAAFMSATTQSMQASAWAPSTVYKALDVVKVGSQVYQCTVAGTSGGVVPSWPNTAGQTVTDGTAQWALWTTSLWCTSGPGVYALIDHTATQVQQVSAGFRASVQHCSTELSAKLAQVAAATTVAGVQAIVWS